MTIMKRIFVILFLFLPNQLNQLFSQNAPGERFNQVNILEPRQTPIKLSYKDIDGTPFFNTEFIKDTIYFKSGNYSLISLRYNIYNDEMELMKEDKLVWLNKKDIKLVHIGADRIILETIGTNTGKLNYFFLRDTGKYTLLVKKNVVYVPSVPPKGYSETIPPKFVKQADDLYLKEKGMPLIKIKSKKDLTDIFVDNKPVLDFIKTEKIKVNPEDLHKLITFLNNL